MALLYQYREDLVEKHLKEYYSITGAKAELEKVDQIVQMFR
jgi:hypothetical protein